jgi:hypothetical protein
MKVLGVEVSPVVAEKEPVLDVPTMVMSDPAPTAASNEATDSVAARRKARDARASKAPSTRGRSKRRGRPAANAKAEEVSRGQRRAATPSALRGSSKRRRDGSVGRETFAAVEVLVKKGKTKTEAFRQVAEDTGKNSGTVAAAYYRMARASGAVKPRQGRATQPRQGNMRRRARVSQQGQGVSTQDRVEQVLSQLLVSVEALAEAVRAQDAEVRVLRGRLGRVRLSSR